MGSSYRKMKHGFNNKYEFRNKGLNCAVLFFSLKYSEIIQTLLYWIKNKVGYFENFPAATLHVYASKIKERGMNLHTLQTWYRRNLILLWYFEKHFPTALRFYASKIKYRDLHTLQRWYRRNLNC